MKQIAAIEELFHFSQRESPVFTTRDLAKIFNEKPNVLNVTLHRLVKAGVLVRAVKSVYVQRFARNHNALLEHIARAMRRPHFSYVSLESALSQYSVISQMPQRLTIMTTGRKGEFKTPFGTIEFTHTKRSLMDLDKGCVDVGSPLPLATKETAYRDLKRVGRNLDLVDFDILGESDEW